jgi:hypothetical protein
MSEPTAASFEAFEQATPYQFRTLVPKDELEPKLDQYWAETSKKLSKAVLDKAYKGFRQGTPVDEMRVRIINVLGGAAQFYEPVVLGVVRDAAKAAKVDRDILSWIQVQYKLVQDRYEIMAQGYFEPEVKWKPDVAIVVPRFFRVYMEALNLDLIAQYVNGKLTSKQEEFKQPEINDDLAVSAGFETLAQMRSTYEREAEDSLTHQREERVAALILQHLGELCLMTPLPESWRQYKAVELYQGNVSMFKSEAEFIKQSGYSNRDTILSVISASVTQRTIHHLIWRAWGRFHGIEGDSSLTNMHQYADAMRSLILKEAVVLDTDPEGKTGPKDEMVEANNEQAAT